MPATIDVKDAGGSTVTVATNDAVVTAVAAVEAKLPAAPATAAKQPAPGTAGTPSADVLSVQGVTGGTPLPLKAPAVLAVAGGLHVPAANTAAVVTLGQAGAGAANVVGQILWSYSAAPTGGRLTVTDGAVTVVDLDITAAGPGEIVFDPPLKGTTNTAMTITLAAGGSGVAGKVMAPNKRTE